MRGTRLLVVGMLVAALAGCAARETAGDAAPAVAGAEGARALVAQQVGNVVLPEGVTVTGVGRVMGVPDTLRASVGVSVVRGDVSTALDEANAKMEQVIAAVRERGIAEEDIQTREFTVQPEYDYPPNAAPRIRGYAVRNLLEITIRNLESAGELLGEVTRVGGDDARVENVYFALEDNQGQLQQARQAAFEDARQKAEQYAQLAGRELGDLVSLNEMTAALPQAQRFDEFAGRAAAEDAAVPIAPGQQEVAVNVQATWSLR